MVKINKIYTRTGDKGETGLVGGKRVSKDSPRVEAYGDVDELNSFIGWCVTLAAKNGREKVREKLSLIQNELFDIGSELATPPGSEFQEMLKASSEQIKRLEESIDEVMVGIPELRSFVLPGGTELNSALHIARTVCRRAERRLITLAKSEEVSTEVLIYFNRLSDLLFAMSRYESHEAGVAEYLWKPGGKSAG